MNLKTSGLAIIVIALITRSTTHTMAPKTYYVQASQHPNQPILEVQKKYIKDNKVLKELLNFPDQEENSKENPLSIPFNAAIPLTTITSFFSGHEINMPKNLSLGVVQSKNKIFKKMYDYLCLATYMQNLNVQRGTINAMLRLLATCDDPTKVFLARCLEDSLQQRKERPVEELSRVLVYQSLVKTWFNKLSKIHDTPVETPFFNFEYCKSIFAGYERIPVSRDAAIQTVIDNLYEMLSQGARGTFSWLLSVKLLYKNATNPLYNDNVIMWDTKNNSPILFCNKKLAYHVVVLQHTQPARIKACAIDSRGSKIVSANATGQVLLWLKDTDDDTLWHCHELPGEHAIYYQLYFFSDHTIVGVGRRWMANETLLKVWDDTDYSCTHTFIITSTTRIQALNCYDNYKRCIAYNKNGKFYEYDLINKQLVSSWLTHNDPNNPYAFFSSDKDYTSKLLIDTQTGRMISGYPYILWNKDHSLLLNLTKVFSTFIPLYFTAQSDIVFKYRYKDDCVILKASDIAALQTMVMQSSTLSLVAAVQAYSSQEK